VTPVSDAERKRRLQAMLGDELRNGEPQWWWLSFVDPDRPEGDRFLGVVIVEARGPTTATQRAHDLGINPGGEVAIVPLPGPPRPEDRERLLTRAEVQAIKLPWVQ
jgi:hypothetical protein